jgi:ligand-binding SRPBCC domain-containing protein
VRWEARVEEVSPTGFLDRQVRGPFEAWAHRHSFVAVDEETTGIVDEVEAQLKWHALWGLVGLAMWLGLPLLFAYRGYKTRRLLEGAEA